MSGTELLLLQISVSFIAYIMLTIWYVLPKIKNISLKKALMPLIWIHVFRNIGLSIMAPGASDPALPDIFKAMVGYGDVLAAALAILSLIFLRYRLRGAILMVWIFNIVGFLDLVNAFYQGILINTFAHPIGATWVIVTMYVPVLWVSSAVIFYLLVTQKKGNSNI